MACVFIGFISFCYTLLGNCILGFFPLYRQRLGSTSICETDSVMFKWATPELGCHCGMNLNFSKEEMFPDSSSPPPGCCLLISKLPAYNLCCIETHLAVYAPLLPGDWNHLLWTRCLVELLYYRYIDNKGGSVIQQVATETELSLWRRMSATVLVHKDTLFFNMFFVCSQCLSLSDTEGHCNKRGCSLAAIWTVVQQDGVCLDHLPFPLTVTPGR